MSKRPTQIEKAIENIDAEIRVLQLARERLVKQQPKTAPRAIGSKRTAAAPTENVG